MAYVQSDALFAPYEERKVASYKWTETEAAAADDDLILEATDTSTEAVTLTEFAAQPSCARQLTVKSTGTASSIAAQPITIYGTNIADQPISETITPTASTAINATTVKAFKTVTKVTIGAMAGTAAKIKIGTGVKFGLPSMFKNIPVLFALENGVVASNPTITADDDELEKNVIAFNTTPNGKSREVIFIL